jgi:hypothetical protein
MEKPEEDFMKSADIGSYIYIYDPMNEHERPKWTIILNVSK